MRPSVDTSLLRVGSEAGGKGREKSLLFNHSAPSVPLRLDLLPASSKMNKHRQTSQATQTLVFRRI